MPTPHLILRYPLMKIKLFDHSELHIFCFNVYFLAIYLDLVLKRYAGDKISVGIFCAAYTFATRFTL